MQFEVVNGRTAYSVAVSVGVMRCGARLVRTVVLERRNSGRVHRTDSGWVAIESGVFNRPTAFVKGCVKAFHNIRRIRITGAAFVIDPGVAVRPVVFDADAEIEAFPAPSSRRSFRSDRLGYVQVQPPLRRRRPGCAVALEHRTLRRLFETVGPISGPVDGLVRVGGTLDLQLSGITSDLAPDDLKRRVRRCLLAVLRCRELDNGRLSGSLHRRSKQRRSIRGAVFRSAEQCRFTVPRAVGCAPHARERAGGLLMTTQASRALFLSLRSGRRAASKLMRRCLPILLAGRRRVRFTHNLRLG